MTKEKNTPAKSYCYDAPEAQLQNYRQNLKAQKSTIKIL